MKVREVMTREAVFCGPESTLAEAAFLMRKYNCGFLAVVGEGGNVIGVITDRDVCVALVARNRKPTDLRVWEAMPHKLFTCMPGDDLHCALKTMRGARVRRLPVIDRDGSLAGMISIDDIVLRARERFLRHEVAYADVENAYKAIRGRPMIVEPVVAISPSI